MSYTSNTWTGKDAEDPSRVASWLNNIEGGLSQVANGGSIPISVKTYGAVGDGTTDDTTACQNAINAVVAAGGGIVYFPVGTYKLTAALTVNLAGVIIQGASAMLTVLKQTTNAEHGITLLNTTVNDPILGGLNGQTNYVTIKDLRLRGTGQGVSTGHGIHGSANTNSHNGDWCRVLNVMIDGFEHGWYFNGYSQTYMESVLSDQCGTGGEFDGTASNCNDNKLVNVSTAKSTTVGIKFGQGYGNEIHSGDHINEPLMLQFLNGAHWTIQGGEFENVSGAGTVFVDVQGGARVSVDGANFIVGGGNTAVDGIQVAASAVCGVRNLHFDPLLTGSVIHKTDTTAVVTAIANDTTINTAYTINENGLTTFPAANVPFPQRVDNAIPAAASAYRGLTLLKLGRDGAGKSDGLLFYRRNASNNYDQLQLLAVFFGTGDPNGVTTGLPGDVFVSTSGSGYNTLWVKENGTGNTGWAAVGYKRAVVNKTGTYTATTTDSVITADATSAAFTVTLPTAVGITGRVYTIKRTNSGANAVTVGTTSSQTIDGSTTQSLASQYATLTVISDGANWQIINKV